MRLDRSKPVLVYRNLKHGRYAKPLYSVMQDGRVVRRVHRILLIHAQFVVRPAGHARCVRENRKNVHAFVRGKVASLDGRGPGAFGINENGKDLPVKVVYNPYEADYFKTDIGKRVNSAIGVLINERGVTAAYLE